MLEALQSIVQNLGYGADVAGFVALFGLGLTRIVTAISLTPFMGGRSVPAKVKVGLAAVITAVLYPAIAPPGPAPQLQPVVMLGLLVKEAMIGAILGLLAQLVFFAVQTAGAIIDTQRGMDQPAFLSPQLASNTSILANLKIQTAIVLFLSFDGHLAFLHALHASFQHVPLVEFPGLQAGIAPLVDHIARVSAQMLVVAVQLAAPIVLTLFLVDVSFGALGKVAGRINVHAESQPVKSLVGLAMVFLAIGFLLERLQGLFGDMIRNIYEFLNVVA
jgi:flagellar biosynthesis protein FliR